MGMFGFAEILRNVEQKEARGVAFLCSEDGAFITGSTLSINGGQHMY